MISEFFGILFSVLTFVNVIFAMVIVFFERKNPAVTWAWLMVLAIFPWFGFLLYLVLGFEGRKHKTFAKKCVQDEAILHEYLLLNLPGAERNRGIWNAENFFDEPTMEYLNDIVFLNFATSNSAFTTADEITMFYEGNAKFDALLKDIRQAKEFIHMQYYIVRSDILGKKIIHALAEKAKEGVEVRFLYDGMGNLTNKRHFTKPLTDAGGEVGVFLPPQFIRINYRNHRKIAVIDGNIGYIGGFNIGDEYIGQVKRFGFWRDSHIRITGDAVKELELRFICDWNFTSKRKIDLRPLYFPPLVASSTASSSHIQIVSSGPDSKWNSVQYGYNKMICEANKKIYMQTPYFVPDDSMFEMLKMAALSGIDVRIMFPAHPDHFFVYWANLSYMGDLLSAGVKCYKYEKGFIHSKVITMDGLIASVGTANMDVRSFKLNFEVNAFIYDPDVTKAFDHQFLQDIEDSTLLTEEWYHARSRMTKIKEAVSRLISPML